MLIWAADRPERDALTLPAGVEIATVPRQPADHPISHESRFWSLPTGA
ncbi:MAG TPA: hypothetical protein VN756_08565 [Solirubrobacterales bacterium]|nr:hypothetical protein [Solirubrobacterales bacterium]